GIAMAGEAQFVELEQRKVGGLAHRDLAKLRPADTCRRASGGPAQRVLVADLEHAIARPLQQERGANLLHQIGSVIRRGAIDTEADADARRLHLADRTAARRQQLVAAGAVADARPRPAQPLDLLGIEEDAVRKPGAGIEPAALLEIIERTAMVELLAECV